MNERGQRGDPEEIFSPFDRFLGRLTKAMTGQHRPAIVICSWTVYAALTLGFGLGLGVSANYFIILPLLASAVGYGFSGGLIAGALGLPANLALFEILGHPEFSPASKPIAEISGVVIGAAFGYLSDYYRKLQQERQLRLKTETDLRQALKDRDTLLKELHHRVKNNLYLVKSLINMQGRRSADLNFQRACETLSGRVMALSIVHEQLFSKAELTSIDIRQYLGSLIAALHASASDADRPIGVELECADRELPMDTAIPLGLVLNEALTNAFKYGHRDDGSPLRVLVRFGESEGKLMLDIRDDGRGMDTAGARADGSSTNLGMRLMDLLADQLDGSCGYLREEGWTVCRLRFPAASVTG